MSTRIAIVASSAEPRKSQRAPNLREKAPILDGTRRERQPELCPDQSAYLQSVTVKTSSDLAKSAAADCVAAADCPRDWAWPPCPTSTRRLVTSGSAWRFSSGTWGPRSRRCRRTTARSSASLRRRTRCRCTRRCAREPPLTLPPTPTPNQVPLHQEMRKSYTDLSECPPVDTTVATKLKAQP
eukprot:scaffold247_cov51-Phaeocystis_antarctica.AAC.3